jgi:hypothetical protein
MANNRNRTGGDASKRNSALARRGQGARAKQDRGGRGIGHRKAEEHSKRTKRGWF